MIYKHQITCSKKQQQQHKIQIKRRRLFPKKEKLQKVAKYQPLKY